MKTIKLLILLCFPLAIFACDGNKPLATLASVNAVWQKHPEKVPAALNMCNLERLSFNEKISLHLLTLCRVLGAQETGKLTPAQTANRKKMLEVLAGYAKESKFPINRHLPYQNPVFIDDFGTHCAVGYLIQQSGNPELAQQINREHRFDYIKDITTPGVKEWAEEFGFTLDELAWIQPGYLPAFNTSDLSGGLNGSVYVTVVDSAQQTLYAGGNFTQSTGGLSCNAVAVYKNGPAGYHWENLGSGLNGPVFTLALRNNILYAGGEFTLAGGVAVSNIAAYDLNSQQWMAMGSLDSAVYALEFYQNELYAGGRFTHMVARFTGGQWQALSPAWLYGQSVRSLAVYQNILVIGGKFELPTGAPRKNAVGFDGTQFLMLGFGTPTPVNDLIVHAGHLYAACDFYENTDSCVLAAFNDQDWVSLLLPGTSSFSYIQGQASRSLLSSGTRLFMSGSFGCSSGMTYGNNLAEIFYTWNDTVLNYSPLLFVDSTVHCMSVWDSSICFGGDFVTALGDTLNHIAKLDDVILSAKMSNTSYIADILLYPNPAGSELFYTSTGRKTFNRFKIFDLTGKLIREGHLGPETRKLDVNMLPNGSYLIQFSGVTDDVTRMFVKENSR